MYIYYVYMKYIIFHVITQHPNKPSLRTCESSAPPRVEWSAWGFSPGVQRAVTLARFGGSPRRNPVVI